jgi:tetratricopeptide (TPR) repeat protein
LPSSPSPPGAPFAGHVVVFTGKLWSLSRREALALVTRLGGLTSDEVTTRTTMLVVGSAPVRTGDGAECGSPIARGDRPWPGDGEDRRDRAFVTTSTEDGPGEEGSQKLRRARTINDQAPGRIRIVSEDEFCALADLPSASALRAQFHALHDILAMYPHLREDRVRYLQKWGIVRPALRTHGATFFSFADVAVLRHISAEIARGMPFRSIVRTVSAERRGQMVLDFRSDAEPARIVALRPRVASEVVVDTEIVVDHAAAERYFTEASALDDGAAGTREEAAARYRQALEADPYLIPALINLGNLHYARDELVEAQALYERAIALAPDVYEAHFNLGNVHHDLGRLELARQCYADALDLNPDYAEAHFYLAVTLEKMGRSQEAKPHWRAYQRLAPEGEWIDLAREFSD